jgi:transcriptional regulator with XRE-family HTH domain
MDDARYRQQVGQRLRIALEGLGIGQREVARETGISHQRLNAWLQGKYYPDPFWLAQLANKYAITTDWIYLERTAGMPAEWVEFLGRAAREAVSAEAK